MLISNSTTRALDEIAARERDVLQAYAPGAAPQMSDVARPRSVVPVTDPLSAAAPQESYFVISGDRARMLFTRDGSFGLRDGTLVDAGGNAVLGYAHPGSAIGALRLDPVDAAFGFAGSARIEADGSVTYERSTIDPRTGKRESRRTSFGQIALARFAPGTKLQAIDPQHFAAPSGVAPHIGRACDGNLGALTCFAREGSGIDVDLGLQRLQEAYLALDAIRAAGKVQGGIQKTAMDLLK